jgi:hypothetical protein
MYKPAQWQSLGIFIRYPKHTSCKGNIIILPLQGAFDMNYLQAQGFAIGL